MGPRTFRFLSVFLALLWIPWNAAAITRGGKFWWGSGMLLQQPIKKMPSGNPTIPGVSGNASIVDHATMAVDILPLSAEIVQTIGSKVSATGHVVNFETRYTYFPNTDVCGASIVVENPANGPKTFRANVSLDPRYERYEDVSDPKMTAFMDSYQFHLKLLCRQLQSAFLNGHKVSVTGLIESMGNVDQNSPASLRIGSILSTPEGAASADALPFASTCLQGIDCAVEGTPISFSNEATQVEAPYPFCQVTIKTASGDQKVFVTVPFQEPRNGPAEARRSMHTLDATCEALLEVMGSQKTIGVIGRGVGGNLTISRISSPGPFTVDMPPLF